LEEEKPSDTTTHRWHACFSVELRYGFEKLFFGSPVHSQRTDDSSSTRHSWHSSSMRRSFHPRDQSPPPDNVSTALAPASRESSRDRLRNRRSPAVFGTPRLLCPFCNSVARSARDPARSSRGSPLPGGIYLSTSIRCSRFRNRPLPKRPIRPWPTTDTTNLLPARFVTCHF
jgi:hypothetical protein